MSYRRLDPAVEPPQVYDIPGLFLARILSQVADFSEFFNFGGHTHDMPRIPDQGEPEWPGIHWCQVTIRLPSFPIADDEPALYRYQPVEVVVEASRGQAQAWDPRMVTEHRHGLLYGALVGWTPAVTTGAVLFPTHRSTAPSAPYLFEGRDSFQSSAVYRIHLGPT